MKFLWSSSQVLRKTLTKVLLLPNVSTSVSNRLCGVSFCHSTSPTTCTSISKSVLWRARHCTFRPGSWNSICTSSAVKSKNPGSSGSQDPTTKDYTQLYLFQKITFLRVLSRFAKYSSLIFVCGTPLLLGAAQIETISLDVAISLSYVLALYSLLFTGQTMIFSSKVVGKIMISSDEKFLKISHLSLFGARRDIYVSPKDVIPLSGDIFSSNIRPLKIKNVRKTLLFLPKQGGMDADYETLEKILMGEESMKDER